MGKPEKDKSCKTCLSFKKTCAGVDRGVYSGCLAWKSKKSKVRYWRVSGQITEEYEEVVWARCKSEAIKKAERRNAVYFDGSAAVEISRKVYYEERDGDSV